MNCNNCNNKASITFNNIDWCISCFMSADSKQLASQEIEKKIQKEKHLKNIKRKNKKTKNKKQKTKNKKIKKKIKLKKS